MKAITERRGQLPIGEGGTLLFYLYMSISPFKLCIGRY